jgi:hypothetical protein
MVKWVSLFRTYYLVETAPPFLRVSAVRAQTYLGFGSNVGVKPITD